jgi:glucokinase
VILAGDVGGTKILLEAGDLRSGRWEPLLARRYLMADFDHVCAVIDRFMAEWEEVKPSRSRFTAAALGVAGPVQGNKVKMTNRGWSVDGDVVAQRFAIPKVRVVNDLAAAANGLGALSSRDFITLQPGRAAPGEPRVVLGIGTGLGVAYLVPGGKRYQVVPGEGGHVGFSPASEQQAALWRALASTRARVEVEHVCSGIGISDIYGFLRRDGDCPTGASERADPAWISQSAMEKSDATCVATLDLFAECLGNVAGDHALAVMARGGVYLAGGVIAKIAPAFNAERFRAAFCAKSLFSAQMMRIPVKLVRGERLALLGAAHLAASL